MRRHERLWRRVALSALGLMVMGCEADPTYLDCAVDKDCLESEICNPDTMLCVQVCTTSANCPDTAKTCEALSADNPTKICRCKAGLCMGGT